ncbi:MAG TPA: hypothetical protein VMW10_01050, partial [Alphaproteobacteria bacterium]|nr:hypothetical protein [Alphaproteobacteria bacterium]
LYSILIGILAVIYVSVTGGIAAGAYFLTESIALTAILGVLFGIYGFYLLIRIGLTYLLISIDQENPLRVGWRLLKGNVLRLLGLLLLISLVILLVFIAGSIVLGIFGWILSLMSTWLIAIPLILFFLFGLAMWLLIWAVTSKAFALVYKTFTSGKAF